MVKYDGVQIYDESNYGILVNQTAPAGGDFGSGYDPESMGPFASACPEASYPLIPRGEWAERIRNHEAKGLFPSAWYHRGKVQVLDQGSWGYCWLYGVAGAVQCRYAMTGQIAPHINPFPTAYRGKNGANRGGWGGEALEYIKKYGLPTADAFPGHSTSRAAFSDAKYLESAAKHHVLGFAELQRSNFAALMSMFLSDKPLPVSLAFNWWGHLVYGIRPVVIGANAFGIEIVNSWKITWGDQGRAILAEAKATAAEQICIDLVTAA